MINISLLSEYSFKKVYSHMHELVDKAEIAVGVADYDGTYGHVELDKLCREKGIKPLFAVRLMVILMPVDRKKQFGPRYIFIAKNNDGLHEIYRLTKRAWDNFYYHPRIFMEDVVGISDNVFVISEAPQVFDRLDYLGLSVLTPAKIADDAWAREIPLVAINHNSYVKPGEHEIYELFAGNRSRSSQTYPQHVLSENEWSRLWHTEKAIAATYEIAAQCNAELPRAEMVKYTGRNTIDGICRKSAKRLGIDLDSGVYGERYHREMELIKGKGYEDYFLVVSDMIEKAKRKMLVGPGRGSSAGSLVCYLAGIVTVDPIEHGLLFERFIDINRLDLPDIDIDFPDSKRHLVIKDLMRTYGESKVRHLATIARMKPKSAIGEFAKGLAIPKWETEDVKGAIVERSGGDARSKLTITDTFETTEVGKAFIEEYPEMKLCENIEGHARHSGIHAAGIIVSNEPLSLYSGINTRKVGKNEDGDDVKNFAGTVMLDKTNADHLNLLKIDCLGLRTLSILEDCIELAGGYFGDYYKLSLDDPKVFKVFNEIRVSGVFQFEGYALQSLTRVMGVEKFDDIVAITALARPGPIHSGGAKMFAARRTGQEPVEYLSQHPAIIKHTKETLGIIIYQEQLMTIGREYGGMSWEHVSDLRRAASKSLGEEFFNKYRSSFLEGTREKNIPDSEAITVWNNMMTFGSWGFNKSHAVVYGIISYWCAWAKAYHPMEFSVASLNHARSKDSALKILRDMVKNDGIEYVAFDPDISIDKWSVHDGVLYGGLLDLPGIGKQKAKQVLESRKSGKPLPRGLIKTMLAGDSPYNILFPCEHYWGKLFTDPKSVGLDKSPTVIDQINDEGTYVFVAKLVDVNIRDLNEYENIVKRGGKLLDGPTVFLNFKLEDDTASIICTIDRFKFERIGRPIAETGKPDHDWYLVKGSVKDKRWRKVQVTEVINLWDWKEKEGFDNSI